MSRKIAFVFMITVSLSAFARSEAPLTHPDDGVLPNAASGVAAEITDDPAVRFACWHLLAKAKFGLARNEFAAFVIRNDEGRYWWLEWRYENSANSASWKGAFPRGTVAILHTHPNWLADPSVLDAHTARTTHIPVYVITRTKITATDGVTSRIVINGEWRTLPPETKRNVDVAARVEPQAP